MVKYYYSGDVIYSSGGGNLAPGRVINPRRKTFEISDKERILIISAAKKMAVERSHKLVFLTPTFPFDATEREASKIFVNFMDNFVKTYKCKDYVWVKERQQNGRLHYHLLCDIPFFDITKAQNTWNRCINNVHPHIKTNNHSLRLPDKRKWRSVVDDAESVAKYIAKYITKEIGVNAFLFRAYQISKSLFPIVTILGEIEFIDLLYKKRLVKRTANKYCQKYFFKK